MTWFKRAFAATFAATLAAVTAPTLGFGQTYPSKPIELIVPFVAGGSTDVTARMLAPRLSQALGQPVIVMNRPGSGGTIGAALVARAQPDGYTLLLTTASIAINAVIRPKLPYRPIRDLAPVVELTSVPLMLLVHPSVPATTMQEFVEYAKARSGKLNYSSGGTGTTPHLAMELINNLFGIKTTHIPYKGNAEVASALLSGEVPITLGLLPPFLQYVKSGAAKPLLVTTKARIDALPDTPTIGELGHPNSDVSSWQGILAPAGTPPEVIAKLNAEIVRILQLPEVREAIVKQGADPVGGTPEAFATKVKNDVATWQSVIEASGIQVE